MVQLCITITNMSHAPRPCILGNNGGPPWHCSISLFRSGRYVPCAGAVGYFETSALTGEGVADAVMAALRVVQSGRRKFTWPWKKLVVAKHFWYNNNP